MATTIHSHAVAEVFGGLMPPAMGAGLLRRFCACGVINTCGCGLPRPTSGWSVGRLTDLRDLMRTHADLDQVAMLMGETRRECNRALDALLGRTPTHALAALEAAAEARS